MSRTKKEDDFIVLLGSSPERAAQLKADGWTKCSFCSCWMRKWHECCVWCGRPTEFDEH